MKNPNSFIFGAFFVALLFGSVAEAQALNLTKITRAELDNRIAAARKDLQTGPSAFCNAEDLIRELDRREPNILVRAEAEYFAAICALSKDDVPAMWRHTQAAEALLPISDGGHLRTAVESLALDVAAGTKDPTRYGEHIGHVAEFNDPDLITFINGEKIFANLSNMPTDIQDKAYLALAASRQFSNYPGYFRQAIAESAILPAMNMGKSNIASKMINEVSDIDHVYPLLIDRRYEPLWPEIDKRVGPHMGRVAEDFVRFSKKELADEPDNRWAFGDVVRSLVVAGRNREAISIYQTLPKDSESVSHYQPGDAWATNAAAVAFDRTGRRAEADQAYDLLTQVSPEANPWIFSLWNIRTGRLADQGRWQAAMAAGKEHLAAAERFGDYYAQTFAAVNLACIAPHLADTPADPAIVRANAILMRSRNKLPIIAAVAAFCQGDKVSARTLTLAALENEDTRGLALLNLQPWGASKLPVRAKGAVADLGDWVRSDPDLLTAFNRYGRFIPPELYLQTSTDD